MTWAEFWDNVKNFFSNQGWPFLEAFLVLVCGIIIIKIIMVAIKTAFKRSKLEKITQTFLLSIIKYALYLVLIIIVLQMIGIPMTTFIAALSAAGLAIGLALQNSLTNLASGIIIVSTKPFKSGDYISVNGVEGTVKSIQILTTTITTIDNKNVIIPNSVITSNSVTNYHSNDKRRVNYRFSLAYSADMQAVKKTIMRVFENDGRVLKDPAPMIRLDSFGESGLNILAACWVDTEDYWDVYWDLNELILNEFNRDHITIPYNQLEVRMRTDKPATPVHPLPKRVEKVRSRKQKTKLEDILEEKVEKKEKRIKEKQKERAERAKAKQAAKKNKTKKE